MHLEPLGEIHLSYRGNVAFALPYGDEEGTAYGQGDGTVKGERLQGTVRWSNFPHRRSDGAMLPNVSGEIEMTDGAHVLFRLRGGTVFEGPEEPKRGRQLLAAIFES